MKQVLNRYNHLTRKQQILLAILVLLPVVFVSTISLVYPDFLLRRFLKDSTHDYFYNGLLLLNGNKPQGLLHPGTPLYLPVLFVQLLLGGSVASAISNANMIIEVTIISISLLGSIILFDTVSKISRKNYIVGIISVVILYATPAYFYHVTVIAPLVLSSVLSLVLCIKMYEYLTGRKESVNMYIIGIIIGIGAAIKITSLSVIIPVFGSIVIKNSSDTENIYSRLFTNIHKIIKISLIASAIFIISITPTLYNFPMLLQNVAKSVISGTTATKMPGNGLLIYCSYLIIGIPILSIVVSSIISKVNNIDIFTSVPVKLWTFFSLSTILAIFASSRLIVDVTPTGVRRLTIPLILSSWSGSVIVDEILRADIYKFKHSLDSLGRKNIMYTIFVLYLVISSGILAYTALQVDHEYKQGEERRDFINKITADRDRVAMYSRSASPETFHYWGNYHYAYEKFTNKLIHKYPNVTMTRKFTPQLYTRKNEKQTGSFSLDESAENLFGSKRRHPHDPSLGTYIGYTNESVDCIIYPERWKNGTTYTKSISKAEYHSLIANSSGFEGEYIVDDIKINERVSIRYDSSSWMNVTYTRMCRSQ